MTIVEDIYKKKAAPALTEKFSYKSPMAVPKLEKVVINTGVGRLMTSKTNSEQEKFMETIIKDLAAITGQRAMVTKARKSIAGFKLRQGMLTGAKITLRGTRMYDFIGRLIHVSLPRSRDFRGLKLSSVDENGNLTIGVKEHIFFPEISIEQIRQSFGLEITIVTTAKTREEGLELLLQLGFPFEKKEDGKEI